VGLFVCEDGDYLTIISETMNEIVEDDKEYEEVRKVNKKTRKQTLWEGTQ
jgi:hypothetical protein